MVFMDIAKDVDGHMVAIPKKHMKNILDCDVDSLNRLMSTVRRWLIIALTNVVTKA